MKIKAKSLLTAILLSIVTFALAACNGSNDKSVPVYQGMIISDSIQQAAVDADNKSASLLSFHNTCPQVTALSNDQDPIDQDNPFNNRDGEK